MAKTAQNSLTGNNGNLPDKKTKTIYDVIKAGEKQFAAALPKHVNSERFVRIAITQIRNNPKLAGCNQESLLGALMTSAQLGLEPGVLGQCYLIPYGRECQFQISYKGLIELLRRSGQLSDIYAYTIYKNDEFSIEYGLHRDLVHKPALGSDKGSPVGYYAVAKLKDGTTAFEFMSTEDVEAHGKRFSKTFNNGPWKTDFEAMAHKTAVKKLLKWLPVSVEFIENMRKDETVNVVKDAEKFDTSENVELETKEEDIIDIVEDGVEDLNAPITDEQTKELIEKAEFLDAQLTQEIEKRYKVKLIGQITQGQYLEIKEWLDDGAPTE